MKKIFLPFICLFITLQVSAQIFIIDEGYKLYTVNTSVCSTQFIGYTGWNTSQFLTDIAIHPINHNLYGITNSGQLVVIDKQNATPTYIVNTSYFNALTFDSSGTLYGAYNFNSYIDTINENTGEYKTIGFSLSGSGGDLAYFHNKLYQTTFENTLQSVDQNGFNVLDTLPGYNSYGLVTVEDGCESHLYSFSGGDLYDINLKDVQHSKKICSLAGISNVWGAASSSEATPPSAVNLGPNIFQCNSTDSVVLDANIPGATYVWQDHSTNKTFTTHAPGKYWVTVNKQGCISRDTITVLPSPGPPVKIGPKRFFCPDQEITFRATLKGAVYLWNVSNSGNNIAVSLDSIFKRKYEETVYISRFYHNCISRDTAIVTLRPTLNLGKLKTLCTNDSIVLKIPNNLLPYTKNNSVNYRWNNQYTTPAYKITQPGKYWLTITDTNCSISDTLFVSAMPLLKLGPDTILCSGKSLTLSPGPGSTIALYKWQNNSTNSSFTITEPGKYWATISKNNCKNSDTIIVSYVKTPAPYLGTDEYYCSSKNIILHDTTTTLNYKWQDNSNAASFTVNQPGKYWITATDSYGCSGSDTINLLTMPQLNISEDTTLCQGETLKIQVNNAFSNYLWNDNSTNNYFETNKNGTYWVKASLDGCERIDTINVNVTDCITYIKMPNLVTPNGDGLNDVFEPVEMNLIQSSTTSIFNTWGEQVFHTDNLQVKWACDTVSDGVYYWQTSYVDSYGKHAAIKGWVQITR